MNVGVDSQQPLLASLGDHSTYWYQNQIYADVELSWSDGNIDLQDVGCARCAHKFFCSHELVSKKCND